MSEFRVWIVSPKTKDGLFVLNIIPHARKNYDHKVAQTLVTREELTNLTDKHNLKLTDTSPYIVSLPDAAARELGWDFGVVAAQFKKFAL